MIVCLGLFSSLGCVCTETGIIATVAEAPPCAGENVTVSSLEECLSLALARQPSVAAARASLAAAAAGQASLLALRVPECLSPELRVRRAQASIGVRAAQAAVEQAEHETVYAVTRTYFTVSYAREQEKVARRVVDRLKATGDIAAKQLNEGAREVTAADVDRAGVYQDLAEVRHIQASEGVERAIAALKEAIGLGPLCELHVAEAPLPQPEARPERHPLIALALERRGELAQASAFAESACLEIEAQMSSLRIRVETFAAGADIHSHPVPTAAHDGVYRPGGLLPEMPTLMVGPKSERTGHACALSERAAAVAEKTRNLIVLETEDAFRLWEEASLKAAKARQAAERGEKLAASLNRDFVAGLKVRADEVINAHVLAAQARSQYNEFVFGTITALADLERITGGGFCAGLSGSTPAPAPAKKDEGEAK
jgi:outer membrane protein TolC